jgi:NADH-quinone oxidoreductase subunit M
MSSFKANFWYAVLAASTLILGAAYSLWLVKRVVFGEITNPEVKTMQDLSWREFALLAGLAVPVLVVGVWPRPLVDVIAPTVDVLLAHVMQGKL